MLFYSTQNKENRSPIKEAVLKGLADDNGLYMPEFIPLLPASFINHLSEYSLPQIGYAVLKNFFCPEISEAALKSIVEEVFDFPIPVKQVTDQISVLELFHGPTMAFKDVGARFLARVLSQFTKGVEKEITVLVATSGDTGSAVANGFLDVPGIRVVVLYPKGMVSEVQEKQFTTLGKNITAIEVDGTFDDCQAMVKEAFLDKTLRSEIILTSANSINLARLLPQAVYYFHAFAQIAKEQQQDTVIAVPSGNFGNLAAGILSKSMGLPVQSFIAATNVNDVVPQYLKSGKLEPRPSVSTVANAMDVGNPSNFVRIQQLFNNNWSEISQSITGLAYTDKQIRATIKRVFAATGYILDPHGATAFSGLEQRLGKGEKGLFLATAHPAKFPEVVEQEIGVRLEIPHNLVKFQSGRKQTVEMHASSNQLKNYLLT
ncbi:threonine synthase [Marinilabiliaceae bacterium JC017]|nr:threonine synthase [Marinilabiliaceae bacterium JC017]